MPISSGGAYCIDKTEVVYQEYDGFFLSGWPLSSQPSACGFNQTWTPAFGWPSLNKQRPVVGANWCQAASYCAWAGKRLCGKIGGGSNAFGDYADPNASQWYSACSAQGVNGYPYSGPYDPIACNGFDYGQGGPIAVQQSNGQPLTTPPCMGGTLNLWHMSGNLREWTDSCDANSGASDNCRLHGGSYLSGSSALTCGASDQATRASSAPDVGFRCCAD